MDLCTAEYTVKIVVEMNDSDCLEITSVEVNDQEIGKDGSMAEALTFTNTYTKYVNDGKEEEKKEPKPPAVVIPDDPTPLEPTPEIPEEDVPLAEIPETGDASALLALMTAVSGSGLAWLGVTGKKRKEEDAE